jgi:ATP-dependent Zn protease
MNNEPSKQFRINFNDVIEADTEEEAWSKLLDYLAECVQYKDVTVFDFEEVKG